MTDRVPPIARIRLARSVPRMLLVPVVVGLAGGAAMAFGLLAAGGPLGIALAAIGGILVLGALVGALVLLSVHVDVEESAVVVARIGGAHRHVLTPGPVTRVRVRGANAARLRVRFGALGWGIGRARLRDEEEVALVRLAPTRTVILIPTEHGRLAVAPASDEELLDALSRAAQARQRTEEVASAMPAPRIEPDVPVAPVLPQAPAQAEPPPVPMTGIERALLEERLAREHADEEHAREVVAAAMAASAAAAEAAEAEPVAELVVHPAVEAAARPAPSGRARRWVAAASFVLLPTAAAAIVLAVGVTMGEIPPAGSDVARITALALVLAGPATSIGAVMALAWWPRIVGIVVAGGLAAAVFIGRSLIG